MASASVSATDESERRASRCEGVDEVESGKER